MANTPKLVVLSAYPRTGKTTISGYLQELGFVRLASDSMREVLFNKTAPELAKDPDFEVKEYGILWPTINYTKMGLLLGGVDVVVDASTVYNDMRRALLDTREFKADKYLIMLRTGQDELVRREMTRSGSMEYSDKLASCWEEPSGMECRILEYQSNAPEDLDIIKRDLHVRFRR